jgi:predicted PurR-regulated permease PerM
MNAFLSKYGKYIILILVSAAIIWVFALWRNILLPFLVGLALAYLLLPVVRWIERTLPPRGKLTRTKRFIAVCIVFAIILALLALIVFFAVSTIGRRLSELIQNAPDFITNATARIQTWISDYLHSLPPDSQNTVNVFIQNITKSITGAVTTLFSGGSLFNLITSSIGAILGFAALPLFLFYLLKDAEHNKGAIFSSLSPVAARHVRNIFDIIETTLGRYLRGQLILGSIVGGFTLVGLLILQAPLAIPLAIVYGLLEMVPTIGPIMGGIIMLIVMLAEAPEKLLPVLILALAVQLLENNLFVPRVQSATLRLNPALLLFLLVLGGYLWGFWGILLMAPLSATLIEVFKYVHHLGKAEADNIVIDEAGTRE